MNIEEKLIIEKPVLPMIDNLTEEDPSTIWDLYNKVTEFISYLDKSTVEVEVSDEQKNK